MTNHQAPPPSSGGDSLPVVDDGPSRRDVLALFGSTALATVAGCAKRPDESAIARATVPSLERPGVPSHYATSVSVSGRALPLIVETREGRPLMLEINPSHPMGAFGTTAQIQGMLLDVYDPSRLRTPLQDGKPIAWEAFRAFIESHFAPLRRRKGRGIHVVSECWASPTFVGVRDRFDFVFPEASWTYWESVNDDNERRGLRGAYGRELASTHRFGVPDVVAAFDCDFLATDGNVARNIANFAQRRYHDQKRLAIGRLYAVESAMTLTGSNAEHRRAVRPSQVLEQLWRLAASVLRRPNAKFVDGFEAVVTAKFGPDIARPDAFLDAMAGDLARGRGQSLVVVGRRQPPEAHALAAVINDALGNLGSAMRMYPESRRKAGDVDDRAAVRTLAAELEAGRVDTLVTLGGNPAYDTPGDVDFTALARKAKTHIRLTTRLDESCDGAHLIVPRKHFLEAWGDTVTADGFAGVAQPAMAPLAPSCADLELLDWMGDFPIETDYGMVQAYWEDRHNRLEADREVEHNRLWQARIDNQPDPANMPPPVKGMPPLAFIAEIPRFSRTSFQESWVDSKREGYFRRPILTPVLPNERPKAAVSYLREAVAKPAPPTGPFEVVFAAHPFVHDGRFANNPWMHELPDPITGLVWGNAAQVGTATAAKLGVGDGDHIRVEVEGRAVEIPVVVVAGCAEETVALTTGHGRHFDSYLPFQASGVIGTAVSSLQSLDHFEISPAATVSKAAGHTSLARMSARGGSWRATVATGGELAREIDHQKFLKTRPSIEAVKSNLAPFLARRLPTPIYDDFAWSMIVDTNACIGCQACVVACAIENNVPAVGHDEMNAGRDLHWIRIERYAKGAPDNPRNTYLPVMCQHCGNAPCEAACELGAISTSPEGINEQTYEACGGQKTCLTACPFDVRRFREKDYSQTEEELVRAARNPDVTVRPPRVAEKCTLCAHRLHEGLANARLSASEGFGYDLLKNVQPACAKACPAGAINFGNPLDTKGRQEILSRLTSRYPLPANRDLRPLVTYLAKVRRPNPQLEG